MRKVFSELFGYGLASAVALAVDLSVLEALVNLAGWNYLPASALSFISGGAVAYLLSVKFVFRFRQVDNGKLEFGYFVGLGVAGILVNAATLFVTVGGAGLDLFRAKLLAAGCTFVTNFTLRRQVLFSPAGSR
jgi:putative flippase GtrA